MIDKYKVYSLNNFRKIQQVQDHLSEAQQFDIEMIGHVLPFKVNNYVIEELINWKNIPEDPIFQLTFPQKGMLSNEHFNKMSDALRQDLDKTELKRIANEIRYELNPHPAGQESKGYRQCNVCWFVACAIYRC